jgi:ParB/RepB/Spo0J family partition protein
MSKSTKQTKPTQNTGEVPMSQTQAVVQSFDPADLLIDKNLATLRLASDPEFIAALAKSILEEGQIEPGVFRATEDGLMLVAGASRLAAVKLLREQGHPEIEFKAVEVDATADQALRIALHENDKRKDFTDMERARNIQIVRERFKWQGKSNTSKVTEFFGYSQARTTQLERLLTAPEDVQAAVQAGTMRADAALELLNSKPEKRAAVKQVAVQLAQADATKSSKSSKKAVVASQAASVPAKGGKATSSTPAAPPAPPKVQGKHVRAAIKKVAGAAIKQKAAKLPEVKALLDMLYKQDAHPFLNALVAVFNGFLVGTCSEQPVIQQWEDIADKLPRVKVAAKATAKAPTKTATKKTAKPAKTAKTAKPATAPRKKATGVKKTATAGKSTSGKKKFAAKK